MTDNKNNKRLANLKARRKLWLNVHLYLGLVAGLFLAVIGLTGGLLVFYQESQPLLRPDLYTTTVPTGSQARLQPLDNMLAAAEKAKPPHSEFTRLYYPYKDNSAYKFLYSVREQNPARSKGDGYLVFVDPYTLNVNGIQLWFPKDNDWARPLPSFIMQLHWCLLLGRDTGRITVGILGLLGFISVLTGLIVWWPLTGKFKQALTIKRSAGSMRRIFDLHKTIGFYVSFVLLSTFFSGVYMNLPDPVNTVAKLFTPIHRPDVFESMPPEIHSTRPINGQHTVSLSAVENIVQKNYPSGRLWMLNAPKNSFDVFVVMKRDVDKVGQFIGYQDFAIDQYSGQIIKTYTAGTGSAGDVLLDWQWPLHSGHAFGWTGRILVLLAGLACPVLYVTGVMRWLQKRRAKRYHLSKVLLNNLTKHYDAQ
ncbi:PepSY-associated TM helix domain-containing protein [Crenothrix polyspora]|uniref:PepSY-associated TM helix domain protein n=1 Tax=Crenothrix polyspora TaxID=360316 RepID=A0A1R4H9F7_9GAMM|nr:PepSY-associated TM helix domain-containing protein [Crenothrix polyspora]SJM92510.1 PepSY-associated TM helix domain protein [Crenothrix polyspora]